MIALIVFLIVVAVIVFAGIRGGTRVPLDERGWWPAYRRDGLER